ncbi:MAG: ParB/RepB/Spo0J family partition protein [Betaproteobacteria bacterium]|nr:ParB/RepB/Spo0J family partition protein [Betaproteobacteria bacterium]
MMIDVAAIAPNPWQPRSAFDQNEIANLASSIAEVGLIQPIVVRRVQTLGTASYELIAGERRWRAHQRLGRGEIKATVIEASNDDMAILALVENIERQDLSDYEIAKAIRRAEKEFPSRKGMAKALGMTRSDFYHYLAFDSLPTDVTASLEMEPRILGRSAASDIQRVIRKWGEPARTVLSDIWPRVRCGGLDQGQIVATIEAALTGRRSLRTDRDLKKLFIGRELAGSITRDSHRLTVTLRTAALSSEKEGRLRMFVEDLLRDPG